MKRKPKTASSRLVAKNSGRGKTPQGPAWATESEEIVLAIRRGKIDALVMSGDKGEHVVTLQDTEHPYRVLVETINEGAGTLGPDGTVLYANKRFADILRIPLPTLLGSTLESHISPAGREILKGLIAKGLRENVQGEVTLDTSEGRSRLVRFALNPLQNADMHHICVVATELTELVAANEALKSNEESLRLLSARLLKLQDEERRHIARDLHDITGQKLAVQSMALSQVLNRNTTGLDDESRRMLTECSVLSKQVAEEIRTLSYLLHPPLLDELGLSSAVKWYAEGFERRTGIRIEVQIASDFLRLAPDVEVTLFRIIQESLTNVHRYSGSSKAEVRVEATTDEIKVEVRDFGKGMSREMLSPAPGTTAPLGVGIQGMKERMRQLGGTLAIASRAKQGTQVTATLPLSQAHLATVPEADDANGHASAPAVSGLREGGSRKRILIADDHELLRRGVREMLQKESEIEICGEAVDGQDAVDKAAALRPDLVILDINMPVLNGLAAVRRILRDHPQTKILVFTVHDSDQTVKEIRAAGAHACLSKGKGSQDLLRVVRNVLSDKKIPVLVSDKI